MFKDFPVGAMATVAELEDDPHPLLARLRATEPVSWLPAFGGWLVTRYDLALSVLRDPTTFTVDDPRFSTSRLIGPSMLSLDGPTHTRHREPFARPLRPAPTRATFTAFVEAEADRLVTGLATRTTPAAELRGELAGPLAVAVVAEVLGLEGVDAATVRSWYGAFVDTVSDITAGRDPGPAGAEAFDRLRVDVEAALAAGGSSSLLVRAAGHGELTPAEVVANTAVLMFGGIDTTEGMITNALVHLLGNPEPLAAVRADPDLLDAAIEESVRLEPAASVVDRYATRDTTLGTVTVAEGDLVRVSIAGADRDPAVFPDPDIYDIRRDNVASHLAFAHGPHFCFGAHLARLETRTALRGLLEGLPGLRLDPHGRHRPHGLVFRKPPALHVTWGD